LDPPKKISKYSKLIALQALQMIEASKLANPRRPASSKRNRIRQRAEMGTPLPGFTEN
jgi:hypothetical protein